MHNDSWQLIHGEALRTLRELPDACADATIADPPYSSGGFTRSDRTKGTTSKYVHTGVKLRRPDFDGDSRDGRGWLAWSTLWLSECLRITKPGGYCLVFTDWRQLPNATDALQCGGWIWRGLISWDKGESARAPHTGYYRHQCEYVVWGTRGVSRKADGGPWPGSYRIPVKRSDKHHLTGKPTELMRRLVACVPADGLVVDPFAGSGTTGVACLETGRRFLGIEQSAEIHAGALARLRAASESAAA